MLDSLASADSAINTGNTAILANTAIAINTGGPAILASPGSVINPSASSASIVGAFPQPGAGLQMTGGPRTVSVPGRPNWQECWETGRNAGKLAAKGRFKGMVHYFIMHVLKLAILLSPLK